MQNLIFHCSIRKCIWNQRVKTCPLVHLTENYISLSIKQQGFCYVICQVVSFQVSLV